MLSSRKCHTTDLEEAVKVHSDGSPLPLGSSAILRLAGRQRVRARVEMAGTPEAFGSVRIANSVLYVNTRYAAHHLGQVWRDAAGRARRLPVQLRAQQPVVREWNSAEPSIVVHTRGVPPVSVQALTCDGEPASVAARTIGILRVRVGGMCYDVCDQVAFTDCARAFALAARFPLPDADLRMAPAAGQTRDSQLAGAAAERAARALTNLNSANPEELSAIGDAVLNALRPAMNLAEVLLAARLPDRAHARPGNAPRLSSPPAAQVPPKPADFPQRRAGRSRP